MGGPSCELARRSPAAIAERRMDPSLGQRDSVEMPSAWAEGRRSRRLVGDQQAHDDGCMWSPLPSRHGLGNLAKPTPFL